MATTKTKKKVKSTALEVPRNPHYWLGEDLLVPNVNKCDGARVNMFVNHSAQFIPLNNAEPPRVFTRFENQVGKYSQGMGYSSLKEESIFLGEVAFHEDNKYMFFLLPDKSVYVFHHTSTTRLTENYGYKNNLKIDPELAEGEILPKGTLLSYSNMYDEDLNLQYGTNLKALFIAKDGLTFEDGIIMSRTGASKFEHTSVTEAVITLNNNDVLLNLYGKDGSFQPFPGVGERIKGQILAARRRINYMSILTDFKENSSTIEASDTCFYFDGVIENIEIFSNFSEKDLNYSFNAPIKSLLDMHREKYSEIVSMVEGFKASGYTLTDDCGFLLQKANDYNSGVKFSMERSEFEGAILRFTIREDHILYPGSKITGRYGNKGIISKILEDDEMPRTEDGEIPDVLLNPLGVIGRMNMAQLYEHEINYVSDCLVKKSKGDDLVLFKSLMEYIEILNPTQCYFLTTYLQTVEKAVKGKKVEVLSEEAQAFVTNVREKGFMIHQPPFFGNANPEIMGEIYDRFDIQKTKFVGIMEPLVFGTMYFLQLRHEALSKFSARSAGQVSLLNVPFKSNEQYKKGTATGNSSPIRFGEQETFNLLLLSNGPEGSKPIINFLRHYSSHNDERKSMITKLLRNDIKLIDKINLDASTEGTTTNAALVIRSYFAGMGITLTNEVSDEIAQNLKEEPED